VGPRELSTILAFNVVRFFLHEHTTEIIIPAAGILPAVFLRNCSSFVVILSLMPPLTLHPHPALSQAQPSQLSLTIFGKNCCSILQSIYSQIAQPRASMSTAPLTPVTPTVNTTNMPPLIWHFHPRPNDLNRWNYNQLAEIVD
jgi:hypothetical protein